MKTIIINEAHKKAFKKKHSKKKPSAQEQVGGKVNAAIMGAVTCGGMCEGAEPETDSYTLSVEKDGQISPYYHIDEERGVSLSDETDSVDDFIEYIINNASSWETSENQIEATYKNPVAAFRMGDERSFKAKDYHTSIRKDDKTCPVTRRVYKTTLTQMDAFSFIQKANVTLSLIDYATDRPEDNDIVKDVISRTPLTAGYNSGKYIKITPEGKTNYVTINIKMITVNGEVANPSYVYGMIYHELGHAKNDNTIMRQLGLDKRIGGTSLDYWSRRNNHGALNSGSEYCTPIASLIYRFWEGDEAEQGSAQIFGDLKGIGDTDRANFQDNIKKTSAYKEWEILKKNYDFLEANFKTAEYYWKREFTPRYGSGGALKFRKEVELWNPEKGDWETVSVRKKDMSFSQFMKQTKKRMNDYIGKMGRSASLYYDKAEVNENVNPSSVDLSSFKVQDDLNSKFWKDDRLDSRIRMKLLDIADDFIENLGVNWVEPKDITMTGSLANYNWSKEHSDIDLHIIIRYKDVDDRVEFVREYFKNKKTLWNDAHEDLKIFGFPVEVYVQDTDEPAVTGGVYSLEKDKWITKPTKKAMDDGDLDKEKIQKEVAKYMDRIDELEDNFESAEKDNYLVRKTAEQANKLFDEIVKTRRDALKSAGKEMCDGNIVFKALRRNGYLDKLCQLSDDAYNKMNSLVAEGKLNEDIIKFNEGEANPDTVSLELDGGEIYGFFHNDIQAPYPFALTKDDEWVLGDIAEGHGELSRRLGCGYFIKKGRLWAKPQIITMWNFYPRVPEDGKFSLEDKMTLRNIINAIEPLYKKQVDPNASLEDWMVAWEAWNDEVKHYAPYYTSVKEFLYGAKLKSNEAPSTKTGISNRNFWRHYEVVAEEKETPRQTAYMMVGVPGSGKSTWIKKNLGDVDVVSRDIIRAELGFTSGVDEKAVCTKEQEQEVTVAEYDRIKELAKSGKDFVIDDTNTGRFRSKMIEMLRKYGLRIVFVRMNTDIETCVKRREGQIPADVMRRIHSGLVEPQEGEYDDIINVN